MRKTLAASIACGAALLAATASAQDMPPPAAVAGSSKPHFGFIVQGTLEYGGDELARLYYYRDYGYRHDRDCCDEQKIRAGSGGSLSAGVHFKPSEYSPWDLRLTGGYKYVGSYADNADVYVDRIIAEAVADYRFYKGFFAGAGVIEHFNPKLHGDGYVPDIDFNAATGFTAEAGWRWVALTYRYINYRADGYDGHADASSLGVLFKYGF